MKGKMNCERFDKILVDFIEDDLSPSETEEATKHLQACPNCSRDVAEYKEMLTMLLEEELPKPSRQIMARLSRAAREELDRDRSPFWKKWFYSPILVPVLSSALALFIWVSYEQQGLDWFPYGKDVYNNEVMAKKTRSAEDRKLPLAAREIPGNLESKSIDVPRELSMGSSETSREEERIQASSPMKAPAPAEELADDDAKKEELVVQDQDQRAQITRRGTEIEERAPSTEAPAVGMFEADTKGEVSPPEEERAVGLESSRDSEYYARLNLAIKQQADGNCEMSIKTNEELLSTYPALPDAVKVKAYLSLAECYEQQGKLGKAISNYDNLQDAAPEKSELARDKIEHLMQKLSFLRSREAADPAASEESMKAE